MISVSQALAFALASFIIIVIPGPSVLFVVGRALAYGRRTALASVAGNEVGALVAGGAVALGIGTLVERSAAVFTVLKLAGAAYLVYLGVRAFRRRGHGFDVPPGSTRDGWRAGLDGFFVGVSNPKTMVFFGAVLPQFVEREHGRVPGQMFVLALIFVVIALVSDSVWGLVASGVRAWFGRSPRRLRFVGGAGGLSMISLGIALAVTGRRN
jgi:threonine/homoserine/homoserine lactone efflux protein